MPAVLVRGPYLTPAPGGITVNLRFDRPVEVSVAYGSAEACTGDSTCLFRAYSPMAIDHRIVLTDLVPVTRYRYRVTYGTESTGDLHFLTCPAAGGPVTFLVMGDTRDQPPEILQEERFGVVAQQMAAEPEITFVVHLGDFVLDGNREEDWDRFFRIGGLLLANTTLFPVRGNHDGGPDRFTGIFGLPLNYSFSCGDVHLAVLDSGDESWGDLPGQARWLDRDLAEGGPFRFVALHYPLYSSDERHMGGWENLRKAFAPVLARQGVRAVFQGHVHLYERDVALGIQYVTDARGGAPPYRPWAGTIPEYRSGLLDTLGYTRVTVRSPVLPALMEVIRVADIRDGEVTLRPPGTVFERVLLERRMPGLPGEERVDTAGLLLLIRRILGQPPLAEGIRILSGA